MPTVAGFQARPNRRPHRDLNHRLPESILVARQSRAGESGLRHAGTGAVHFLCLPNQEVRYRLPELGFLRCAQNAHFTFMVAASICRHGKLQPQLSGCFLCKYTGCAVSNIQELGGLKALQTALRE